MKITIAIPCLAIDIPCLDRTLSGIKNGTVIPDEVVITASQVEADYQHNVLEALQNKFKTYFKLIINECFEKLGFIQARNALTQFITGDLILYHDADDIQHPQRIEIVKHFFEENDIVHLCHSYRFSEEKEIGNINYSSIRVIKSEALIEEYKDREWSEQGFAFGAPFLRIHAGACCIKKEVLEKVGWGGTYPGEDCKFCLDILRTFGKTILIDAQIYIYDSPKR